MNIYITAAVFILICSSCQFETKRESEITSITKEDKQKEVETDWEIKEVYSKKFFPNVKLINGDFLFITYSSYGCFTNFSETINIKKDKTRFAISLSNKMSDSVITKQMDSAFQDALDAFSIASKKVIQKMSIDTAENDNFYIRDIHKITIMDGLHRFDFFVPDGSIFKILKRYFQSVGLFKNNDGS